MASVFVVMGNDYPDCAFDERWKADIYVDLQRAWQKKEDKFGGRIYYSVYEFEVNLPGMLAQRSTGFGLGQHFPTKQEQEEFRASLRTRWHERLAAEGTRT